jgi:NADH-quinone oxidoreductase E subunit
MIEEVREIIDRLIERFPQKESALLPALCLLQTRNGYITENDLRDLSEILNITEARIFSAASFYTMLRLKPLGKYHIQVCNNVVCALLGSDLLFDYLSKKLNIHEGEITPDGLFSIAAVECLASCGNAPAMQINMEYHENVDTGKVDGMIDSIRKREGGK